MIYGKFCKPYFQCKSRKKIQHIGRHKQLVKFCQHRYPHCIGKAHNRIPWCLLYVLMCKRTHKQSKACRKNTSHISCIDSEFPPDKFSGQRNIHNHNQQYGKYCQHNRRQHEIACDNNHHDILNNHKHVLDALTFSTNIKSEFLLIQSLKQIRKSICNLVYTKTKRYYHRL